MWSRAPGIQELLWKVCCSLKGSSFFLIYIRVLIIVLHRWDFLLRFSCFQRESFRVYYWYKYLLSVFWQMKHYTFETSNDSDLDKKGNLLALKANIQLWEFVQFLSTGEIIEEIKEGKVSCKCVGSPLSYSLFSTLTLPHSPSLTRSLTPSLTHPHTHSLTPSLTHSRRIDGDQSPGLWFKAKTCSSLGLFWTS